MSEPAAILSRSQNATLINLASKEKQQMKRILNKNILCHEELTWPRPEKSVEETILSKLTSIFETHGTIFKIKNATEEQAQNKAKLRSHLAVGVSSVLRCLEQDGLSCVLVSGQASPAVSVDHVISLAAHKGCPCLCLDQLAPTMAKATGSKCLPLAIGVKVKGDHSDSVFDELVECVKANTSVTKTILPVVSLELSEAKSNIAEQAMKDKWRPHAFDEESGKVILEEFKRIFSEAGLKDQQQVSKKKKSKKKKKMDLKEGLSKSCSHQFDVGKRTVHEALGRNKLQLIVLSDTLLPHLTSEAGVLGSTSLLAQASKKGCPVVCVTGLTDSLRPLFHAGISVLGIKKLACVPDNTNKYFEGLLGKAQHLIDSPGVKVSAKSVSSSNTLAQRPAEPKPSSEQKYVEKDYSYLYVMKEDSKELHETIRKRKAESERTEKELNFSSDFISLGSVSREVSSSEPSQQPVQIKKAKMRFKDNSDYATSDAPDLGTEKRETAQADGEGSSILTKVSESFVLDRGGSQQSSSDTKKSSNSQDTSSKQESSDTGCDAVLGAVKSTDSESFVLDRGGSQQSSSDTKKSSNSQDKISKQESSDTDCDAVLGAVKSSRPGFNVLAMHQPRGKGNATKRKAHSGEGFISFAYTEANIHTMVANPGKKRKKKKK